MTFHTGARVWEVVANETYGGYSMYPTWDPARPYVKYALIQGGAILTNDGDIKPVYYLDVSWDSLQKYLTLAYNCSTFPVLDFAIINIQNVSDMVLSNFLTRLSSLVGQHSLIFDFGWEYNFPSYMQPWGDGQGHSFYISPDVYNAKMLLIRQIIDQKHLSNILLASHANMLITVKKSGEWVSNPNFDGIVAYLAGMRQADVVGFSHYNDDLNQSWSRAKAIYNLIGTSKPCIFFEYAPTSPWQTQLNVTSQFVNDSYGLLNTYPFIKGFIWYIGQYCTNETAIAIGQNAQKYEGWS